MGPGTSSEDSAGAGPESTTHGVETSGAGTGDTADVARRFVICKGWSKGVNTWRLMGTRLLTAEGGRETEGEWEDRNKPGGVDL